VEVDLIQFIESVKQFGPSEVSLILFFDFVDQPCLFVHFLKIENFSNEELLHSLTPFLEISKSLD
jgi:hypothetical protein